MRNHTIQHLAYQASKILRSNKVNNITLKAQENALQAEELERRKQRDAWEKDIALSDTIAKHAGNIVKTASKSGVLGLISRND